MMQKEKRSAPGDDTSFQFKFNPLNSAVKIRVAFL